MTCSVPEIIIALTRWFRLARLAVCHPVADFYILLYVFIWQGIRAENQIFNMVTIIQIHLFNASISHIKNHTLLWISTKMRYPFCSKGMGRVYRNHIYASSFSFRQVYTIKTDKMPVFKASILSLAPSAIRPSWSGSFRQLARFAE